MHVDPVFFLGFLFVVVTVGERLAAVLVREGVGADPLELNELVVGPYVGKVHSSGPFTKADLKKAPTANYTWSSTPACELSELSARTHGAEQRGGCR